MTCTNYRLKWLVRSLSSYKRCQGHSVGKMPSLITKTVTKFLQDRGSVAGWEAAAAANAAQKSCVEDSMAAAAGDRRGSLPAFLPLSEQEKVQLPATALGQAMTGQPSTGGELSFLELVKVRFRWVWEV